MPKGFGGMGMPGNMNQMLKQAQKMQQKIADTQRELEERELSVSAGGGAVKIVITGKKEFKSIEIDQAAVDPDDIEGLNDLVLAAVNEAVRQADALVESEMSKVTGGLNLPGGLF